MGEKDGFFRKVLRPETVEKKMNRNAKKLIGISLLVGLLTISVFLKGCKKSDKVVEEDLRRYFPLSVGNTWTYKRTVNNPPLCSFMYTLKEEVSGASIEEGDKILIVRCDPAVNSGTETYKVLSQNGTDFKVELKDNNIEDGKGDLRDGRYNFEELNEVIWSLKKWPEAWETRKGIYHGNYVESNSLYVLFRIKGKLKDDYVIGDNASVKRTYYYDKGFNIIEPQLGWVIKVPKAEKKTGFAWYWEINSEKDNKSIKVPVGTFKRCLKNTYVSFGGKDCEDFKLVSFYAKDVGLIKEVQYNSKGEIIYELELIEYDIK